MNIKKYLLIITLVLGIGFSYAGSALAGNGGCGGTKPPPPDTNSITIESPNI